MGRVPWAGDPPLNKALFIALLLIGSVAVLPAAAPSAAASPGCTVDEDGADCSELIEELEPWLYCPGPNPLCWNP